MGNKPTKSYLLLLKASKENNVKALLTIARDFVKVEKEGGDAYALDMLKIAARAYVKAEDKYLEAIEEGK